MILELGVFAFNSFQMGNRLHSSFVSVVEITRTSVNFMSRELYTGQTSRDSSSYGLNIYAESLHSSEVVNVRELKFCEGCGVLLVRLRGSKTQLCSGCEAPVPTAKRRMR